MLGGRHRPRPRRRGPHQRVGGSVPGAHDRGARPLRRDGRYPGRGRNHGGRWGGARSRRVVDADRRSGSRLLVPRRRAARHAYGTRRADSGRDDQHAARGRTGRHHSRIGRGAFRPACRPRPGGGARREALHADRRTGGRHPPRGAQITRRHRPGNPHLPGIANFPQRRARRARSRDSARPNCS